MSAPSDEPRDPETGRLDGLAERRARRATETGLVDRAERAERTVGALERRLDEAEGRLEIAQRDRATLSASLEQARRDLTAALQREFAEQRMRAEQEGDASGAVAELESDIARLGADHDAAEARAATLAHALQEARLEVDRARFRADADRQAVVVDENRDGLRLELGELQALAEELHGSLLGERTAREEAEQALDFERERAEAEVTLLQHELDRRALVHEAVGAQIAELRSALDDVRGRTERTAELEQAIATMEGEQRRTGVRLADTRELLGTREAELIAVEEHLVAREAELGGLKEEAEGHRAARREAEAGVASLHDRSADLVRELEEERRRREEVEERLEAERQRYASAEQQLREELETQRGVSDRRLVAVQRTVDALRAELAAAATELEERVATERAARLAVERELEQERRGRSTTDDARVAEAEGLARRLEAVESELADTQAAAARERTRAEGLITEAEALRADVGEHGARADRAEAANAELAAHVARDQQVEAALEALREELGRARAENSDRAEREAAVETLVGDLVETVNGLRVGFERELEGLAAERDAAIAAEREGFAAELAGMEGRVGELRLQLTEAAEQLRAELDEERSARWVAEAELARELSDRALAEERAAEALEALSQELARLQAESAANPFYDVAPAGALVPSADHPALVQPAGPAGASAVVGDLVRAMDRLRGAAVDGATSSAPVDASESTDAVALPEEAVEVASQPQPESEVEPDLTSHDEHETPSTSEESSGDVGTDTPLVETQATTEDAAPAVVPVPPPPPPGPVADLPAAVPVVPVPPVSPPAPGAVPEASRGRQTASAPASAPSAVAGNGWFSGRLTAFARTDEAAAERLLLSSLAAQAMSVTKDVTYELELPVSGRYRVEVAHGDGVSVAPVDAGRPQEVEFRIEAAVGAVTALAGGTAPRRLTDVTVRGRRRRLRRLLRALRAPVGLSQLRSAGAQPPPADLLAMLCDGVEPEVVLGADFVVAYDVSTPHDGSPQRVVVRAQPDGRLGLEPETARVPDATLTLDLRELLAVLDGNSSVAVAGDEHAADTLHRWLRGVQGH